MLLCPTVQDSVMQGAGVGVALPDSVMGGMEEKEDMIALFELHVSIRSVDM